MGGLFKSSHYCSNSNKTKGVRKVKARKKKVGKLSLSRNIFAFNMMAPAILIIAIVMGFPTLYGFIMSFFKWRLGKTPQFIGFENYLKMFTVTDIFHSIWITILFAIVVTILTIVFALFIALLLNMELKGTNLAIALLLIPWAVPPVVNGVMWKWIFNARFGTFNNVLISLGILDNFRIWIKEPWPAFLIIVFSTLYKMLPLAAFLLSASLKTIPKNLYEAAEIDGMSPIGRFFAITLPLIRPAMVIIFILLSVATFKAFDMIFVITNGGPGNFTALLNYMSYITTFRNMKFGLGAAMAFFISFLILIICIFYYRTTYREVRYD